MEKLTAIIPTWNEELHIEDAIRSVAFADEILVVDSFSTDQTVPLAQSLGAKVIQREYENSASQKNWAIPQATHNWILLLDADERVTEPLQEEIQVLLTQGVKRVGYWIYRKNHFMGRHIRYSGWQGDKVIRLFRKDRCHYEPKHVHAEIVTDGQVGFLKHKLLHYTYRSMDHFLAKLNRYAEWQSRDFDPRTGRITLWHLAIKPAIRFLKHYIWQLGVLDGYRGFIIAWLQAYAVHMRYARLFESRQR